jgi:hypothetical protein
MAIIRSNAGAGPFESCRRHPSLPVVHQRGEGEVEIVFGLREERSDARKMRGERPFIFTNLRANRGVAEIADFIVRTGGLG